MKIVREEIFGPVVVAEPFRSLDEIAAEANNTSYGLGAGIWTKDISKAHALAKSFAPGPSGSTATTSSPRPCRSAGTSSPAGAARWATRPLEAYTEVKAVTTQL
jgi:phenylacetaldehyde dehydrogenase